MKLAQVTTKLSSMSKGSGVQMKIVTLCSDRCRHTTTCGTCNGLGKVADKKFLQEPDEHGLIKDDERGNQHPTYQQSKR